MMTVADCSSLKSPNACAPQRCRWRCALDVIDELLSQPGAICGAEADQLLDLRWQLSRRDDPEAALRTFCGLRIRMERRHYLAFFRLRRWLENQIVASVQAGPASARRVIAIKLDFYCIEAVRRVCLCAALNGAETLGALKLRFEFRPQDGVPERSDSALAGAAA